MVKLLKGDCIERFKDIESNSVDLVIVDLPYGQTSCKWDSVIDLEKMWIELKRICRKNAIYCFFCTTKFGNTIINSNPKWFRYDLVWEKSRKVGFLSANKMPLRKHEMIYIFSNEEDDLNREYNLELREYSNKIFTKYKLTNKKLKDITGNEGLFRFGNFSNSQFGIPSEKNYKIFTEKLELDKLDYYIPYDKLKEIWDNENTFTYNSQKTEGKPYKTKCHSLINSYYRDGYKEYNSLMIDNKGDRHPHSILQFNNPVKSLHPTQKPVDILEWLIKSYSNEGDTVLDFTMGSGSTGVACKNTNRDFIGIELTDKYFNISVERILY